MTTFPSSSQSMAVSKHNPSFHRTLRTEPRKGGEFKRWNSYFLLSLNGGLGSRARIAGF